jgi:tellurite resistance protein
MSDPSAERSRRVLQARMAAHALHAKVSDEVAHTAPARKVFLSRFEREVDPDGVLEPQERARRAEHAKKAYFLSLAAKSSRARAGKRRK